MSVFTHQRRRRLLDYLKEITSKQFRDVNQSYYAKDKRSIHLYHVSIRTILVASARVKSPTYSVPSKKMPVSPTLVLLLICSLRIHGYGSARTATSPNTSVMPNHKSNHSCEI